MLSFKIVPFHQTPKKQNKIHNHRNLIQINKVQNKVKLDKVLAIQVFLLGSFFVGITPVLISLVLEIQHLKRRHKAAKSTIMPKNLVQIFEYNSNSLG